MKKLNLENISGNLGNALIRQIYATAYKLDVTDILVKRSKYNKFAVCDLFYKNDCIALDYTIGI